MKKNLSHYESLNVTRDAPAEVIRAAYRSLSQRHHPDKHSGDPAAAEMMIRLNTAYEVLSDPEQRLRYDRQMLEEQLSAAQEVGLRTQILTRLNSRQGRIALGMVTTLSAAIAFVSWTSRKDDNVSNILAQSAVYATVAKEAANNDWPAPYYVRANARNDDKASQTNKSVAVIDVADGSGLTASPQESASAANAASVSKTPAPSTAPTPSKQSDFERLTSMLKSMGLGLHKLEAEPAKPAPAAVPAPASRPAVTPEPARAREELDRPVAAEPPRSEARTLADTSRPAPTAPAAAAAAPVPRGTLVADARDCPTPSYPERAFRNGETGTVLLSLLVGADGRVIETKVQKSSGYPELDRATRKAVAQCKFKAAEGQTEAVWTKMVYAWWLD